MLGTVQTRRSSLAEQTAQQLVEMIQKREYKPGEKIPTEMELAESLNVSRSTVREAVKQLAARNANERDVEVIRQLCDEVEALIRSGEPHIALDVKLHTAIARSTKNMVAPLLVPIINRSVSLFGELSNNALGKETIQTHREITDAIARHDPQAARRAMEAHIAFNRDNISLILSEE